MFTIRQWLEALGLERYINAFEENEITVGLRPGTCGTKWLRDWLEAFASLPPTSRGFRDSLRPLDGYDKKTIA